MKKIIAGLLVGMFVSTSAFAWGPREQGVLAGIAGLWTYQQLQRAGQPTVIYQQAPPVYPVYQQSPPVIYVPQPQQYCEYTVVTDQFGVQRSVPFCYYR